MTHMLLFCVAEQAKDFIPKVLDYKDEEGNRVFFLVESKDRYQTFKTELKDGESFKTDFMNSSEEDCQKWALEKQFQNGGIHQDMIAIADERSASDNTLAVQVYSRPDCAWDGEELGILPRKQDVWYTFRVDYKDADQIKIDFNYLGSELVYPVYYGRKAELTDERGVFDIAKAKKIMDEGP